MTLLLPGHKEYFVFSRKRKTRQGWCSSIHPNLDPGMVRAYRRFPAILPLTKRVETLHPLACTLSQSPLPADQELFEAAAKGIFWEFFFQAGMGAVENPLPEAIQRAYDYIHENYSRPCDLGVLSKIAALTGAHLIRLFRKHLGTTPIKFLWEVRVKQADDYCKKPAFRSQKSPTGSGFKMRITFRAWRKPNSDNRLANTGKRYGLLRNRSPETLNKPGCEVLSGRRAIQSRMTVTGKKSPLSISAGGRRKGPACSARKGGRIPSLSSGRLRFLRAIRRARLRCRVPRGLRATRSARNRRRR